MTVRLSRLRPLLVALALAILPAVPAPAADVVREIAVTGQRRVDEASVRERLTLKTGAPYSGADADQSLKALFATGEFADVKISHSGGRVVVAVVENPVVSKIVFAGNAEIAEDKLRPLVKLKPGHPYTRTRGDADARRIRDHYRKEGRYQTVVAVSAAPADDGRVIVTFDVKESQVNKVARIVFEGATQIPDRDLAGAIATTPSGYFDFLKTTVAYDPERLALDRELLRRYYLKKGHADVIVREPRADYDAETRSYVVTFPITEGPRYDVARSDIDSRVAGIDSARLTRHLPSAGTYDAAAVDTAAQQMTEALVRGGQSFARVKAVLTRDEASRTVTITYRIEEGPPLYVRRVEIAGNARTKDHVIRREMRLTEGDAFSAYMLEKSRKKLMGTGFFKSVEIEVEPAREVRDKVDLKVAVVEAETGDLSFGIGYSTTEGVVGDISFTERNLLGNGQYLKLKLAGSLTRLDGEISFTEPHFLGSDVAAGFDLFYKDIDRTRQSSYKSERVGATSRLGIPITDELTSGLSYTFARNTLYDVGDGASMVVKDAIPGHPGNNRATYYTSAIGTTLVYDGRDNRKAPTKGVYLAAGEEVAGLGGNVNYLRTTGDARGYVPLGGGIVLAGRMTAGVISGWGGQDVRLLDMFYKGNELVRGFQTAGLGPRDLASANKDALGGTMYYGTSAELRFPLPFIPDDLGLRGGVFADAGSLFGTSARAGKLPTLAGNSASPRASVGTELAWDSPVGQLRLGYAVPVISQAGDKTQPFSFSFGPSF